MKEFVSIYDLDNKDLAKSMPRSDFYDAQIEAHKKGQKPNKAVAIFDVLLFTEQKEMILQKRSSKKRHNPYMIDKAVGGHIQYGDSPYYTAMIECVQELRVPAVVLRESEDFPRTFGILKDSLESTAVLELIDHNIYTIDNIMDGERIPVAKNIWMFLGVYSGPMRPVDREASGILYYTLETLEDEMERMPDLFTPDLHFMMKHYKKDIETLLAFIDKK